MNSICFNSCCIPSSNTYSNTICHTYSNTCSKYFVELRVTYMGVSLKGRYPHFTPQNHHFLVGKKKHGFVGVSPTICRKLPICFYSSKTPTSCVKKQNKNTSAHRWSVKWSFERRHNSQKSSPASPLCSARKTPFICGSNYGDLFWMICCCGLEKTFRCFLRGFMIFLMISCLISCLISYLIYPM